MSDRITLIDGLGNTVVLNSKEKKDDLIVGIRVAAMHIYNRAEKYVDELTDPSNTFISIEFDDNGVPYVSVNKSEHVVTPDHVENKLDIKQMWREEDC